MEKRAHLSFKHKLIMSITALMVVGLIVVCIVINISVSSIIRRDIAEAAKASLRTVSQVIDGWFETGYRLGGMEAVSGILMDSEQLHTLLYENTPGGQGYMFLAGLGGEIIAHPLMTSALGAEYAVNIRDLPGGEQLFYSLLLPRAMFEFDDPVYGPSYVINFPLDSVGLGWYLVSVMPVSVANEPVARYQLGILLSTGGVVVVLSIVTLIAVWLLIGSMEERRAIEERQRESEAQKELQWKEDLHRDMLFYTQKIEQQYNSVRTLQHDYKNILSSLYSYIEDGEMDGLKQYYIDKIEGTFNDSAKNLFALEGLSKIKVSEIKSILAAKLMKAQSLGIDSKFEAKDEIHTISIDTVSLVRMLGVIMDNAIEALLEVEEGELIVACYEMGGSVTFVVQNSCKKDIPELSLLKKHGFSTKGEGRGLGLSILSELASLYDNVVLQTSISNEKFTQRLMVGAQD